MKPHTLFFDEKYNEHYYRRLTIDDFMKKSDCLIVVGNDIQTSAAKQIVSAFLDKELPVIELNLKSAINCGHNIQVIGDVKETLPAMFKAYYWFLKNVIIPAEDNSMAAEHGEGAKPAVNNFQGAKNTASRAAARSKANLSPKLNKGAAAAAANERNDIPRANRHTLKKSHSQKMQAA